jgi:tetraacyldisaccharide 4'-kinase
MKSPHRWIAWIDDRSNRASRNWSIGQRICIPLVRGPLWLASFVYFWVTLLRNQFYHWGWLKIHRAEIPVISVGNITAGGTGKTPVVAFLAKFLRQRGLRVAIVSRGYGATDGSINDEALELERLLPDVPHVQNRDRYQAVALATEELAAQVILLDDAMQHRRMHRDLEVVLVDATNPYGFGYLLPRGLLRESLWGLKRAGLLILTRADLVSQGEATNIQAIAARYAPNTPWIEAVHQPESFLNWPAEEYRLDSWQGKKVLAFCGIGNPEAFRTTLERLKLDVIDWKVFRDHCTYERDDVESLQNWVAQHKPDIDAVICTAKDVVKLRVPILAGVPLLSLKIGLKIVRGEEVLLAQIEKILADVPADTLWD